MIGPSPYKNPKAEIEDVEPDAISIGGVEVPEELEVDAQEFISLAEAPDITVPSTYDDALKNDELIEATELLEEETLEIFPGIATKEEVSFGLPVPDEVDVNAFGGGVGKSEPPTKVGEAPQVIQEPLTREEQSVIVQNSVVNPVLIQTQMVSPEYELGTKLVGVSDRGNQILEILTRDRLGATADTDIIEVEELDTFAPLTIVDGGEF
jgi:hypothetical protein